MNRLRAEIQEEEEADKKLIVEEHPVKEIPDNFFTQFLSKGFVTAEEATRALPFVLYIAFLGMIYIGNRHLAENTVRDIAKYTKQERELSWGYKSTKADLAFKSTLSEVQDKVKADSLDLKESLQPPQKIADKEDGQ